MIRRYSNEDLALAVRDSISIAQVVRKLGLKVGGGTYEHLQKLIRKLGLDTSHLLGRRAGLGRPRIARNKRPLAQIWFNISLLPTPQT